jgi:hypothetical protein
MAAQLYVRVNEEGRIIGQPEYRDVAWEDVALNDDGSYALRKLVDNPPAYDSATQKLQQSGYIVTAKLATVNYDIVDIPAAELAKTQFENAIAAGFPVPGQDWRIKLQYDDRTIMTSAMVLLNAGVQAGQIQLTDPTSLTDTNGVEHAVTVAEAMSIILQYGFYFTTIRSQYQAAIQPVVTP